MNEISETIHLLNSNHMIDQGKYDLTADAMKLRGQRPLHCADDYIFTFTITNPDGSTYTIASGSVITMLISFSSIDGTAVSLSKTASITDAAHGIFTVTLTDADMPGPGLRFGKYDIKLTGPTPGFLISTLTYGDIEFLQKV